MKTLMELVLAKSGHNFIERILMKHDDQGYRLITTTYTYYPANKRANALEDAKKGRGEGKRTEVITESEYGRKHVRPMQDLTKF